MKTLLQVGDQVKIRKDIKRKTNYKMLINEDTEIETWLGPDEMMKPGEIVTIAEIKNGKYKLVEENFFCYTDEMFDPELIEFLYEEYLLNK